jgi:hypothetical protein
VTKPPFVSHTLTVPSAAPVANNVAAVGVALDWSCDERGIGGETESERIGDGCVCARVSWRVNVSCGGGVAVVEVLVVARYEAAVVVENG